jgi:uncharacterized protein
MIDHLPDRLDLIATAEAGRVLRGLLPLSRLERVLPALVSDDGELQVMLELGKAADGTRFLSGTIRGSVILKCQRCLENMAMPLDLKFRLGLVQSHAAANHLPARYEPLIVAAEPASTAEIVADEVLLALPIVPVHEDESDCRGLLKDYQPSGSEARENPFAVLAELKQKH